MIERYYTYTVSHCSKVLKYGLYWLLNELEKYNSTKGCILSAGKGNFCDRHTEVYREGLGEAFVRKIFKDGFININEKKIELQNPNNIQLSFFASVIAIFPYKKLINKIEENIKSSYCTDRPYLPANPNAFPKSILIIPWIEFEVNKWIKKYNPKRIYIDCAEYYTFGLNPNYRENKTQG